jgi:hypothetical protein
MQTPQRIQTKDRAKATIDLKSLEEIEEQASQWMILEEHYTEYNLSRREQLEKAKAYFRNIRDRIKEAYRTCPAYSEV